MEERHKTPRIFKGREYSEKKELNSLSTVDSYKIYNQKITIFQVREISEDISGVTLMEIPPHENTEWGNGVPC